MQSNVCKIMLPFFGLCLLAGTVSAQSSTIQFVGTTGINGMKALFIYAHSEPLFHRLDYCAWNGLYPATVDSSPEAEMVTNFAISHNKGIWLPAMDHGHEGTFTWIKNGQTATEYFEWDASYPVNNRTANCLAIGPTGLLKSISCLEESNMGPIHYLLCESSFLWPASQQQLANGPPKIPFDDVIDTKSFEMIGSAGGKLFYYDNDSGGNFGKALEDCHAFGMRLASPETAEELELLRAFAQQLAETGDNNPYLWTSGSNIGTPNCFSTVNQFRWLTTLRDIDYPYDPKPERHRCLYISPGGLSYTSCCEGCGPGARSVCEISLE